MSVLWGAIRVWYLKDKGQTKKRFGSALSLSTPENGCFKGQCCFCTGTAPVERVFQMVGEVQGKDTFFPSRCLKSLTKQTEKTQNGLSTKD